MGEYEREALDRLAKRRTGRKDEHTAVAHTNLPRSRSNADKENNLYGVICAVPKR